jgi:hypothetical protein
MLRTIERGIDSKINLRRRLCGDDFSGADKSLPDESHKRDGMCGQGGDLSSERQDTASLFASQPGEKI